jgi:peroxiredoxin
LLARALLTCLALGSLASACSPAPSDASRASMSVDKAPDFTVDLLTGEPFRLSDHLGKEVVVIDFWTTFCQPCVGSLAHLSKIYSQHKGKGLVVLAVSMDPSDTAGNISPFVRSHGLTMPVAHDLNSRVTDLYNKKSTAPFQVLIGRDGRIIKQRESYQPGDDASIEHDIVAALGK